VDLTNGPSGVRRNPRDVAAMGEAIDYLGL
jgi:hypothetical protein